MDDPKTLFIGIGAIAFILLYVWQTLRYEHATNWHAEKSCQTELQQKKHDEQQARTDELYRVADEINERNDALLKRSEALATRVEAIVTRIENQLQ